MQIIINRFRLWEYDHFRATVSERVGKVEVPEAEYVACGVCDGVSEKEYDQGL